MYLTPFRRLRPAAPSTDLAFRTELGDFFDRFFSDRPMEEFTEGTWFPSVNVSETDGKIKVNAELPGLDSKDIDISVSDDILTIKGEKKEEKEESDEKYYHKERYVGSFQRSVRLPSDVQSDKVEANYKDGVLDITLPKAKETTTKKIKVNT